MSTHPDPGEREQEMIRLASEQPNAATARMVKKERLMSGVNGMVAGENPRQGFVDNGTFYLPDLAVQFPVPSNFQTVNQASRVVLVGPEQAALVIFSIESGVQTAREAAERFASQEGLTVIQSGLGSANGIAAQYVVAEAADENGAITRVRAHYAAYSGRVYSFLGLAAQANFGNWDPSFQSTMQGFAPLRDSRILGIQPARIAVVNADRTAPFQSFVGSAGVGGFDAEGLAILNQLNLNQSIPAGTLFKLVR
jgi:predicted Zn-dependent protease